MLEVINLSKSYATAQGSLTVLHTVNFSLAQGDSLAIVGPSGSGKTTLLGLCAGLDRPSTGSVKLNGTALESLSEDQRAQLRNQYVGFVFQNFQLIPTLTALENVMVPLELQGKKRVAATALQYLDKVGLASRQHHYPAQLSGGEQQRVAIARAFVTQPAILFADEPTGNLDEETGQKVENLLFELNRAAQTTLVLVTHNLELAAKTRRIISIKGGHVVEDKSTASGSHSNKL
jgi:putative ABC transport system ATP-binding protein